MTSILKYPILFFPHAHAQWILAPLFSKTLDSSGETMD